MLATAQRAKQRHKEPRFGAVFVDLAHVGHAGQHGRGVLEECVLLERRHPAAQLGKVRASVGLVISQRVPSVQKEKISDTGDAR